VNVGRDDLQRSATCFCDRFRIELGFAIAGTTERRAEAEKIGLKRKQPRHIGSLE